MANGLAASSSGNGCVRAEVSVRVRGSVRVSIRDRVRLGSELEVVLGPRSSQVKS